MSNQAEQFARYRYRTNKRAAEKVAGVTVSLEWYDDYCDIYHWTATDGNKTLCVSTDNGIVLDVETE